MSKGQWESSLEEISSLLARLSFRRLRNSPLEVEAGFEKWMKLALGIRRKKRTIFLVGNGASASMASHMAADLAKNAQLHTEVFSDLSLITALSNDIGYEKVFAEPLSRRARRGDMLVAISSSGRSPNVLAAVKVARAAGLAVVTLSAMKPGNPLRAGGSLNIYVPAKTYGHAESCHAVILHHWLDRIVASLGGEKKKARR